MAAEHVELDDEAFGRILGAAFEQAVAVKAIVNLAAGEQCQREIKIE